MRKRPSHHVILFVGVMALIMSPKMPAVTTECRMDTGSKLNDNDFFSFQNSKINLTFQIIF